MTITIQRKYKTQLSTIGDLAIDGKHFCFTLEPPVRTDEVKPRAIPSGTYQVTLRESERFKRIMPHVENVPGFEGILIHWGNYPKDTVGCILVGHSYSEDFVSGSKDAFQELLLKFTGPITLTIE